jgi:antibiotic biosynthesis monooxygenase (ABM) superfamily enzyme
VTVLISRRVREGMGAAFEAEMLRMIDSASAFSGHLGGQVIRPDQEEGSEDPSLYHVLFAFDTQAHLQVWQHSAERARHLAAIAVLTRGTQASRQLTGLAQWFAEPKGPGLLPPPKWKVAVVSWLGIFPTVLTLFLTVAPFLSDWPLVPRTMVLTAGVVIIMTWGVAPRLTKWLKPWLYAKAD